MIEFEFVLMNVGMDNVVRNEISYKFRFDLPIHDILFLMDRLFVDLIDCGWYKARYHIKRPKVKEYLKIRVVDDLEIKGE